MIKYGSIQYFGLLELRDRLKDRSLNKYGLEYLDKLRGELHVKIRAIHMEYERANNLPCSHEWVELNDDTEICAKCGVKQ